MTSPSLVRIPLYLLLLILPLAVAGHNIGTGVVAVLLLAQLVLRRRELDVDGLKARFARPLALQVGFVFVLVAATLMNAANPDKGSGSLVFGHAIWALLPAMIWLAQPSLDKTDWMRLRTCLALVTLLMGAVAVTQAIWGFRLQGTSFVDGPMRAQGFYSHPLTFAYVGLLLFPLGCASVAREPGRWVSWAQLLGASAIIYASQSRTAQAVSVLVVAATGLYLARGRARMVIAAVALLAAVVVETTDNPMKQRFVGTLAGGFDVQSGYADDRLAFWDANWQMVKERPILGHGDHLNTAYRTPYYESIGLGRLARKYEAHNMYLQVLVNAGAVGLTVFLAWLAWSFRQSWVVGRESFGGKVAFLTLAALCLGAVTQNAFQDSEVRYAMTLLMSALWLATPSARKPIGLPRA